MNTTSNLNLKPLEWSSTTEGAHHATGLECDYTITASGALRDDREGGGLLVSSQAGLKGDKLKELAGEMNAQAYAIALSAAKERLDSLRRMADTLSLGEALDKLAGIGANVSNVHSSHSWSPDLMSYYSQHRRSAVTFTGTGISLLFEYQSRDWALAGMVALDIPAMEEWVRGGDSQQGILHVGDLLGKTPASISGNTTWLADLIRYTAEQAGLLPSVTPAGAAAPEAVAESAAG